MEQVLCLGLDHENHFYDIDSDTLKNKNQYWMLGIMHLCDARGRFSLKFSLLDLQPKESEGSGCKTNCFFYYCLREPVSYHVQQETSFTPTPTSFTLFKSPLCTYLPALSWTLPSLKLTLCSYWHHLSSSRWRLAAGCAGVEVSGWQAVGKANPV